MGEDDDDGDRLYGAALRGLRKQMGVMMGIGVVRVATI